MLHPKDGVSHISGKGDQNCPSVCFPVKEQKVFLCVCGFHDVCLSHLHAFKLWGPQFFLCCRIFSPTSECETQIVSVRRQQQILDYINCDVTLCECESAVV